MTSRHKTATGAGDQSENPTLVGRQRGRTGLSEVTLRDVAQAAGVSEMTVSRVIRSKGYVAAHTRKSVLNAAAKLGYLPNQIAGALASRSTNLIAIVVPTLSNQVYADVLDGIQGELQTSPLQPVFGITDYDRKREEALVRDMLTWRPAGIVLSGGNQSAALRKLVRAAQIPVVQIMEYLTRPLQFNVGVAHDAIGRAMAEHLIERGYRKIVYVGNNLGRDTAARKRFDAFRSVIVEFGASLVVVTDDEQTSSNRLGRDLTADVLERYGETDAIHYCNDTLAVGGMLHCLDAGIAVPDRVALCGYVGLEVAACLPIPLTTVRIPRREIGVAAAKYLIDSLEHGVGLNSKSEKMAHELIVGAST